MKNLLFSTLFLLAGAALFTACKDDNDTVAPNNITDLAANTADLSTLVEAVKYAGLEDVLNGNTAGKFTVFAPTNAAFSSLLSSLGATKLSDLPSSAVKDILLYHVVAGEVRAANVTTGYVPSSLNFTGSTFPVSLFANTASGVKINEATVTTADVLADNGVVHIIDKVMVPPTVVNHALNNPNFSILVAALTRSDLGVDYVGVLSGTGPFTVFAPTNSAFAALLTELNVADLNAIDAATLNKVLQYHVVANANVRSGALTDGQVVPTFGGQNLTIDLDGGAKIIDANNRTSNIVVVDVQATNGVIHAIDKVILPQL
ncbi:MAG: fasciclin domain-containing protein [Saprospiraceae bacterium]|nr:fasciclin domain-containing protein [Saprospiraceae bacterium]